MSDTESIPPEVLAFPEDSYAVTGWARFRRFASYIAGRYNGPVYLVGSALRSGTPRDIDIRVIVADDEFCGRYGYETHRDFDRAGPNQRWIDDMAKRNGEIARDFKVNSDFQVYAAGHCIQFHNKPRITLAAPSNLDHIVACTAWFYGTADSPIPERRADAPESEQQASIDDCNDDCPTDTNGYCRHASPALHARSSTPTDPTS